MTGHRLRSRVLLMRPNGHRWAWFCSCSWWQTGRKAEGLRLAYERHLEVRP